MNETNQNRQVRVIPATKRWVSDRRQLMTLDNVRVAAYCRVSTGDESQQTSYTKQVEYYTRIIHTNPRWQFAGIYADEAATGTSRKKRVQFNRMISDAMEGEIDYIITKSISRFARNTLDALDCVRQMQQLDPPVGVYFEKENIDTLDVKSELILTILSAMAQDESRSISDNIRWTFQRNFQEGKPHIDIDRLPGYNKGPKGEWLINDEEAETVRYIFQHYLDGESGRKSARDLNAMGKKTSRGNDWYVSSVFNILRNEKFVGDCEMQKTITQNFLTHESIPDNGEAPKYYVKDHHEGIIDRKLWDAVQQKLKEM